jgi:hypothetical protein
MFNSQKPRKHTHSTQDIAAAEGHRTFTIASIAWPPSHVWIPNHPQATTARSIAGIFAPLNPKDARTNTGNGMPYLAPACAFRIMGTSTIRLPSRMVPTACFQSMPPAISDEASM